MNYKKLNAHSKQDNNTGVTCGISAARMGVLVGVREFAFLQKYDTNTHS
jgi:hypothetical protein